MEYRERGVWIVHVSIFSVFLYSCLNNLDERIESAYLKKILTYDWTNSLALGDKDDLTRWRIDRPPK